MQTTLHLFHSNTLIKILKKSKIISGLQKPYLFFFVYKESAYTSFKSLLMYILAQTEFSFQFLRLSSKAQDLFVYIKGCLFNILWKVSISFVFPYTCGQTTSLPFRTPSSLLVIQSSSCVCLEMLYITGMFILLSKAS